MPSRRAVLACLVLAAGCSRPVQNQVEDTFQDRQDHHSFANPGQVRARHVHLDLDVDFKTRTLRGSATLTVDRKTNLEKTPVLLDTRDLKIDRAETSTDGTRFEAAYFELGQPDKILGAPLTVQLPPGATMVRVWYETSPGATGLQWLTPEQTAGKKHPFLYSQSQAIHARSWIPLQDSPGIRVTYSAVIRTPEDLLAVMSARNDSQANRSGEYKFQMPQPVPSYLIALGVGDLRQKAISRRAAIYAEPPVLDKAVREFEDTEKMIEAAEQLFGPYRWQRYDLLILPPSFPYGGMENPRLTFLTPTVLAGDKSLVSLISHELAHSWSGNLVTNATSRDFWLNEGFTNYLEYRIQEVVYGPERAEMEAFLSRRELEREFERLDDRDEVLYVDLKGRDPEEGSTSVPYVKGMLFLRRLEEVFGRPTFDMFLRGYFTTFAFQSITTGDFVRYIRENLLNRNADLARRIDLDAWLTKPGLPPSAPRPKAEAFERVSEAARAWTQGKPVSAQRWSTHEMLHFLTSLPEKIDTRRMAGLDRELGLTATGNNEVLFQWLLMSVRSGYQPAYGRLERFMLEVGRRKYVKPLYEELVKTPEGRKRAEAIYARARSGYHPITAMAIDDVLKPQ